MTLHDQHDQSESLEREAHRWITLLVSGEATTADAEALGCWRKQSPAHEAAFADAAQRWKDFGPAARGLLAQGDEPVWVPPSRISRRAMLGGAGALAASAAGYAVIQPPLNLWPSFTELTADYRTATGEQRQVTIGQEVAIKMNTQTSLSIPASIDAEQVKLIAGEASFNMPKRVRNPLVVLAGTGRTLASRGRFDVRNVGSSICVTCFDGEVRVEHGEQASTLSAKQQVRYDSNGLQPAVSIDPAEAAAWQEGVLVFRLTPLSDVIAEINRYRPGKVVLMNSALARSSVNGRFRIKRLDEVLVWIEQAFGATPRSLPGGILLLV